MKTVDWILVTGQPGCGKTTAVCKILQFLQENGLKCQGFYTEEVRDSNNSRIGFDVVTVSSNNQQEIQQQQSCNNRAPLARKGVSGGPKTGQYTVFVKQFEDIALPTLKQSSSTKTDNNVTTTVDVFILDEIGRMELHSKLFQQQVKNMLDNNNNNNGGVAHRLIGAITAPRYGHRVPFCDEIAKYPGVQVHNLTKSNRDDTVNQIIQDIRNRWIESSIKLHS